MIKSTIYYLALALSWATFSIQAEEALSEITSSLAFRTSELIAELESEVESEIPFSLENEISIWNEALSALPEDDDVLQAYAAFWKGKNAISKESAIE